MSGTPNLGLPYLTSAQLQPEVTVNYDLNLLDSLLTPAAAFGNNPGTTSGLTYGYFGGTLYSNGAPAAIGSGTVGLTASATNYVQRTAAGVVSVNTTGWTTGLIPMAQVVTGASSITTITDKRPTASDLRGAQVVALTNANVTLTDAQVNARIIRFTGALTANIVVTFPAYTQEWVLSNETTGAYTLQVQTSGGTPLSLQQGYATVCFGNGTNIEPASYVGLTNPMTTLGDLIVALSSGVPARLPIGTLGQVLSVTNGASGLTASWGASGMSNPMTALGDLILGLASGAPGRLAIGAAGQVLTVNASGTAQWENNPAGFTNPMSNLGDMIVGGTSGTATALSSGGNGQVLTSTASGIAWQNNPAGFSNPMTSPNDIIIGGTGGSATRLASGATGQVLTSTASGLAWEASSGGFTNPMTSAGDLILGGTSGSAGRLASGSSGQVLMSTASGVAWVSGDPIALGVNQSSGQSLTASSYQKIHFNSVQFDTGGYYDAATNYRFTPQVAGYYMITAQVNVSASTEVAASVYKNGSAYAIGQDNGSTQNSSVVTAIVYLNGSTDYVEIWAYVGAAVNTLVTGGKTYFQGALLR